MRHETKAPLDAVGHRKPQQDSHTGGAVVVALEAVGDDVAYTAGAHHAQNSALGEIGLQAHSGPGYNLGQSGGQHRVDKDRQAAGAGDLQGLDGFIP